MRNIWCMILGTIALVVFNVYYLRTYDLDTIVSVLLWLLYNAGFSLLTTGVYYGVIFLFFPKRQKYYRAINEN